MNKWVLISISFIIIIIGIGCAATADLNSGIDDSCGVCPNGHVFVVDDNPYHNGAVMNELEAGSYVDDNPYHNGALMNVPESGSI